MIYFLAYFNDLLVKNDIKPFKFEGEFLLLNAFNDILFNSPNTLKLED